LAEAEKVNHNDYIRYGNVNRICYNITTGNISPWLLYHSESGVKFLENLDPIQVKMIIDYINPDLWAIKFKREPAVVKQVKELLVQAKY
jgi:hypothetical protein